MDKIESILSSLDINLNIDRASKISSLCEKWPEVVGPRFAKKSKIFSVQESKGFDIIVVAVSSSALSQELIFYKNDILKKLLKINKELGFKVKDIQFSTKYWSNNES